MPPRPRLPNVGAVNDVLYPTRTNRLQCLNTPRCSTQGSTRSFAHSPKAYYVETGTYVNEPRWNRTPGRMKAPVPMRQKIPSNQYIVNNSPEKLDTVYKAVLGTDGDQQLTEEVKWLAVTHKSFDQGRRGYNDRLAFIGKRIVDLQTSLALLNRNDGTFVDPPDDYEREPFRHPGVDLLPRLSEQTKGDFVSIARLANLAYEYGLLDVTRWNPKDARDLVGSGSERVLAQTLYAIVGAVALQRGGEVAVRIVKERILSRLGLDA